MRMKSKFIIIALPFLLCFFVLYIFPLGYSVYYSVIENVFTMSFVGVKNYVDVARNQYYVLAIKNTITIILLFVPMLFIFASFLAVYLYSKRSFKRLIRAAFVLPMLLPSSSIIPFAKLLITNSESARLSLVHIPNMPNSIIFRVPIMLLFVWKNCGFHLIIILAALEMVPSELFEAATLDGAHGLNKIFRITFPLIRPTLFFSITLAFAQSLGIFKEIYLLYGSYPDTSVYLVQHYMNNHFYNLNYQKLTAAALMLALALCIVLTVGQYIERRMDVY